MAAPDYPKPSVTVDVVIITLRGEELQVLLVKRDISPYKGRWAIPGGFVHLDESLEAAARRELREETGLDTNQYALADWQVQNIYEIYPQWRHRYPPGITHNTEHVFGLQLPHTVAIRLAPDEHLNFQWLAWQDAAEKVFSPSNRAAILRLPQQVFAG